jgi:hypothetical protein
MLYLHLWISVAQQMGAAERRSDSEYLPQSRKGRKGKNKSSSGLCALCALAGEFDSEKIKLRTF